MKLTATVEGGPALARAFQELAALPKREASLAALTAGAVPITATARGLARRGSGQHFADHIAVQGEVDTPEAASAETTVAIGVPPKFFYDYFIEYGTQNMGAWPFYRPALDGQKTAALTLISAQYWKAFQGVGP